MIKRFGSRSVPEAGYSVRGRANPNKKRKAPRPHVHLKLWANFDTLRGMVKIRLTQTGTKNRKTYRLIAIEEGKRRDGRAIEILGFFNPLVNPPQIRIKKDRVDHWVKAGAQLTAAAEKLMKE